MRERFEAVADHLASLAHRKEHLAASYRREESDFVRLNQAAVRQAGSVTQARVSVQLTRGRRQTTGSIGLSGDTEVDQARADHLVDELRDRLDHVPDDPHLLLAEEVVPSTHDAPGDLPTPDRALDELEAVGKGRDLVGILASGTVAHGFANTHGQRNWDSRGSFNLDWSFYHEADKAAKANYAGVEWDPATLTTRAEQAADQLDVLRRPARRIDPGRHRVHLAPAALAEIVAILRRGGFSLRAQRTKTTPLLRMFEGVEMSPAVTLREDTAHGVAPGFHSAGFTRPDEVVLIEDGRYRDPLVSPRSAAEYGVETNGAVEAEAPLSIDMAPGDLAADDVLAELDTGILVSNLWYLNYSDRSACRTTGMTRFATFWVEHGEVVAPLAVMRFDDTILDMLGTNLVALTAEREFRMDPSTYGERSSVSTRLPGALVDEVAFTL